MIKLTNFSKKYKNKNIVFDDFVINEPKIYFVIGESGSGKSTLLDCITSLDKKYSGSCKVNNQEIKNISNKQTDNFFLNEVTYVTQISNNISNWTVQESINLVSKDETKIEEILKSFKIKEIYTAKIKNISEGQKQRVALARALLANTNIIVMDEPTSALDAENSKNFIDTIRKISVTENKIFIISTHDSSLIEENDFKIWFNGSKFVNNLKQTNRYNYFKYNNKKRNFLNTYLRNFYKKDGYITNFIIKLCIAFLLLTFITISFGFLLKTFQLWGNMLPVDNSIVITNTPDFTSSSCVTIEGTEYCNNTYQYESIPGHFGFTEEEITKISEIPGVEDVFPMLQNSQACQYSIADVEGNTIDDSYATLNSSMIFNSNLDFGNFETNLITQNYTEFNYMFNNFYAPPEAISYLGSGLSNQWFGTQLLYGSYLDMDNNDVIIPLHLAKILADQKDISVEELINKSIDIHVVDENYQQKTKSYDIVGIYNDDYPNESPMNFTRIFLGYVPNENLGYSYNDPENYYDLWEESIIGSYTTEELNAKYPVETYANEETFNDAFGTGTQQIIITLEDGADVAFIHQQIYSMFSGYSITSNYDFYHGTSSKAIKKSLLASITVIILATIFVMLFAFLIQKSYYNNLKNEFLNYRIFGVSRNQVRIAILLENIIIISFTLLISIIILIILKKVIFPNLLISLLNTLIAFFCLLIVSLPSIILIEKVRNK